MKMSTTFTLEVNNYSSRYDLGNTHPLDVNHGAVLIVHQLHCEFSALLRIRAHDVLQKTDVIGRVADLLGVEHDLVGLAGLSKASDNLIRYIGTEVYAES